MTPESNTPPNDLILLLSTGGEKELTRYLSLLSMDELQELLHQLPVSQWGRLVNFVHPAELAESLLNLPEEEWEQALELFNPEQLSGVLAELDKLNTHRVLKHVKREDLPVLLAEMDSDDAADILGEFSPAQARNILKKMPSEQADPIRVLLQYAEDSAGGLMQTELVRLPITATVQEAINIIRKHVEEDDDFDIHELHVVDHEGILQGQFSLERLILSDTSTEVSELLEPDLYWVTPELDQEEVANYFQKYNLISLPVVDHDMQLLGRITVDDIVDVIEEEASEDILQMAGAPGEDMVYNRILRSAALRLPWLFTNLLGGLLTGYLMWIFRATLREALVLITFVPVITGMGGNVGTQSSSITVRGFAVGRVDFSNISRYIFKEMRVGALMGLVCGCLLSLLCWVWHGNPALGLVVGIALFAAMTVAASMGSIFPTIFQSLKIDPALASGPFVTTFNDVTGILIYFFTAILFKSWIIG